METVIVDPQSEILNELRAIRKKLEELHAPKEPVVPFLIPSGCTIDLSRVLSVSEIKVFDLNRAKPLIGLSHSMREEPFYSIQILFQGNEALQHVDLGREVVDAKIIYTNLLHAWQKARS